MILYAPRLGTAAATDLPVALSTIAGRSTMLFILATAQLLADSGFESLGLLDTMILVGWRSSWM